MEGLNLQTMEKIQGEKAREILSAQQPALDPEGSELAKHKRESFDMPINVAKVDPLR